MVPHPKIYFGALGSLPKSLGFGRLGAANPFAIAANITPPVVLSKTVASNVTTAAQLMSNGVAPTPNQAVNIIKTLIPPQPGFKAALPVPSISGKASSANVSFGSFGRLGCGCQYRSQLTGLSFGRAEIQRRARLSGFGAINTIAAGAAIGTVVPGIGNAIGAAVGAVVGLVEGLFKKRQVSPPVSAAEIQQAQTWLQQYTQVAGSVVGRNFSSDAINDMITAMAINNPGFWGKSDPSQIVVADVSNFIQEEFARLRYFFQSLATVPVGAEVTLKDIPSLPGHGKTNMNVSYTFVSPGINAPSYVLGAYFAQYFYTMCTIFDPPSDCSGHLTAPFPQMHADILDYVRSSNPGWDTPQPNVVTGTDVSIAAPTVTQEGPATVVTASVTSLAPASAAATTTAAPVPTAPPAATICAASVSPPIPATTPIVSSSPVVPATYMAAPGYPCAAAAPTSGAPLSLTSGKAITTPAAASGTVFSPAQAGFSWVEIAVILAIGLPVVIGMTSKTNRSKKHRHS